MEWLGNNSQKTLQLMTTEYFGRFVLTRILQEQNKPEQFTKLMHKFTARNPAKNIGFENKDISLSPTHHC
eukprot:TRINITY_DN4552_c0_g1_i1.p1 TRINITY_DN4552_c0_g1~~TRINITY_DN4552_c0_g1_i1.p1  ORF type:complete len:70 (+),score=10.08 TRINITY_DN4552_c0_g1_i1:57-266(+)